MIKFLRFFLITTILWITVIILKTSKILDVKNGPSRPNLDANSSVQIKITSEGPEFDDYCDRTGEWVNIPKSMYIFRSTAYYLVDLNMILLNTLQHHSKEDQFVYTFKLRIEIAKQTELELDSLDYQYHRNTRRYNSYGIDMVKIDFNLRSFLDDRNVNVDSYLNDEGRIRMRLHVTDTELNITQPVDLTIKEAGLNKKKSGKIVVCSKFVSLEDDYEFRNFKTWVEYNRHLGYDKLVVYYQDALMSPEKSDYFAANRDFLHIKRVTCLPNMLDYEKYPFRYFRYYPFNTWFYMYFDKISSFIQSQCYFENIDKYDYVMAADTDEIGFIGEQFTHVDYKSSVFNDFLRQSKNHSLEDLFVNKNVDHLYAPRSVFDEKSFKLDMHNNTISMIQKRRSKPPSLLLSYKLFLDGGNMKNLCFQLNDLIDSRKSNLTWILANPLVTFNNLDTRLTNNKDKVRDFNVAINGTNEFYYAFYLCELNRLLVEPVVEKALTGSKFNQLWNTTFGRFFFLKVVNGKSLHDTKRVFYYNTHNVVSQFQLNVSSNFTKISKLWPHIESKIGSTGHFRFDPRMDFYYKNGTVDIKRLGFDLSIFRLFSKFFF